MQAFVLTGESWLVSTVRNSVQQHFRRKGCGSTVLTTAKGQAREPGRTP